jgi:hypothetical protein
VLHNSPPTHSFFMLRSLLAVALVATAVTAASPAPSNCSGGSRQAMYSVLVSQRSAMPNNAALISHVNGSSHFNFSFTTAWFPAPPGGSEGLVVRNVECNPNHHSCAGVQHPEWTNAGALAVVTADLGGAGPPSAGFVSLDNVTWVGAPQAPSNASQWGAVDPRVAYRAADGTYYLTWDNCTANCYPHRTTMLSTTPDPYNASAWTLHGPLLGANPPYTGGAALLFRDGVPGQPRHLAFVGNSNTAAAVMLAESPDGLAWTVTNKTWMTGRQGCVPPRRAHTSSGARPR